MGLSCGSEPSRKTFDQFGCLFVTICQKPDRFSAEFIERDSVTMWVNKTLKPRGRRHACGFTLSTSSPDTLVRVFDAETLTQVHVSFLYRIIMPLPAESLLFAVQMELRKAL